MKLHEPIVMLMFIVVFFCLGIWFGILISKPQTGTLECTLKHMSQVERDGILSKAALIAATEDSLVTAYRYEVHAKYPDVNYPPDVWRMVGAYYAKATVVGIAIGMTLKPVRSKR
jgi:hypothetical protein